MFPKLLFSLAVFIVLSLASADLVAAERKKGLTITRDGDGYVVDGERYADFASLERERPDVARLVGEPMAGGRGRDPAARRLQREPTGPTAPEQAIGNMAWRKATTKALAHLADNVQAGLDHPSGTNGEIVTAAIAGLAFLAAGSRPGEGRYAEELTICTRFVIEHLGEQNTLTARGGGSLDQRTWAYGHAALFLAELRRRGASGKVADQLRSCVQILSRSQTKSGSWCHGLKDEPNPLGYREFNAVGNLALAGLAAANRAGHPVKDTVFERGFGYLKKSGNELGGIGYSTRPGQQGFGEAGRSSGTLLAYLLSDLAEDDPSAAHAAEVQTYVVERMGLIEEGHSSPALHLFTGALAMRALGSEHWDEFWRHYGRTLIDRQRQDGSFRMAREKSFEGMHRNNAVHTLVLSLQKDGLRLFD